MIIRERALPTLVRVGTGIVNEGRGIGLVNK
jgi:hypothetical protein